MAEGINDFLNGIVWIDVSNVQCLKCLDDLKYSNNLPNRGSGTLQSDGACDKYRHNTDTGHRQPGVTVAPVTREVDGWRHDMTPATNVTFHNGQTMGPSPRPTVRASPSFSHAPLLLCTWSVWRSLSVHIPRVQSVSSLVSTRVRLWIDRCRIN